MPFNPGKDAHTYELEFEGVVDVDLETTWNAKILIDGQEVLVLFGIPELQVKGVPLTYIMHSWSSIPAESIPTKDPYNPWRGSAYVKDITITPKPDPACKPGGAFHDTDSTITFKAAVGSGPYMQDVVHLEDVASNLVTTEEDAIKGTAARDASGVALAPPVKTCPQLLCNGSVYSSRAWYDQAMAASTTTTSTTATSTTTTVTNTKGKWKKSTTLTTTTTTVTRTTTATTTTEYTDQMQYEDFIDAQIDHDICACIDALEPLLDPSDAKYNPRQNKSIVHNTRRYRVDQNTLEQERTDADRPCLRLCEVPVVASSATPAFLAGEAEEVMGGDDPNVCVAKTDVHAETVEYTASFTGLKLKPNLLRYVDDRLRDTMVARDIIAGGVGGRTDMTTDEIGELEEEKEAIETLESREAVMADETEETELYAATYFVTVQAINPTGRLVAEATKGITVDITPPIYFDGSRPECVDPQGAKSKKPEPCGADPVQYDAEWLDDEGEVSRLKTEFQGQAHTLAVKFKAVDTQSPVDTYEVLILEGDHTFTALTDIGRAEDWNSTGLQLQQGVKYCAIIRAINAAGLWADSPAQCITIDTVPPSVETVWSVMQAGETIAPNILPLKLSRVLFTEEAEPTVSFKMGGFGFGNTTQVSGIDSIELAVGSRPEGCQVIGFFFASKGESVDVKLGHDMVSIVRTEGEAPAGFTPNTDFPLNDLLKVDSDVRFVAQPGQTYYYNAKIISKAHLASVATGPSVTVLGPASRTGLVLSNNASTFDFSTDLGSPYQLNTCNMTTLTTAVEVATTDGSGDAQRAPGYTPSMFAGCTNAIRFEGLNRGLVGWSQADSTTTTSTTTTTETSTTSTTTVPCFRQTGVMLVCGDEDNEGNEVLVNVTHEVLFKGAERPANETKEEFYDSVASLAITMIDPAKLNCTCVDDRPPSTAEVWPEVASTPPNGTGSGLAMGILTYDDVVRVYNHNRDESDCAGYSDPYIHNPYEIDYAVVSRRLVGRIYGYQNVSFYATPLGHQSLSGPLTLAIDFDPEVYAAALEIMKQEHPPDAGGGRRSGGGIDVGEIIPIVAYYSQVDGKWHDVESTCPQSVGNLGPQAASGQIRVEICETNPSDFDHIPPPLDECVCEKFCASDSCEQRCQRGDDDEIIPACPVVENDPNLRFMSAETHFALFWGNSQLVNTAPVTDDVRIEGDEGTIQSIQLNFTDAESDVVTFSYQVPSGSRVPGHLTVSDHGLLTFKPAPYFNGEVVISYKVNELIFAMGMKPMSSPSATVTIVVRPIRSPPLLIFMKPTGKGGQRRASRARKIMHGEIADVSDMYTDTNVFPDSSLPTSAIGAATEMPLQFEAILIDVDSADAQSNLSITTYFDESSSGNSSHVSKDGLEWADEAGFPSNFDGAEFMFGQRDAICGGSDLTAIELDACGYPWNVLDRDYGIYKSDEWAGKMRTHTWHGAEPGVFEFSLLGWNDGDKLYSEETLAYFFIACAVTAFKPASNALACTDFGYCDGETTYTTTNGTFYNDFECAAVTDCNNDTHYTLVQPTFYKDAVCAPYTTSTTTLTSTTTTPWDGVNVSNVTETAIVADKSNTVAILVPILVILLLVGIVVGGKVHEKKEEQWAVDTDIAEVNLLVAMGSAWEIEEKDLMKMGAAFIKQLPKCEVCGQRGLQSVIDAGTCCVFEMGKNSVSGDCLRFLPRKLVDWKFTSQEIHHRMTRTEAIDMLRHYGTEPGHFFLQYVSTDTELRAGQLSVSMWAVGAIDLDAGEEKLDKDGTNNTWVRTCNIIQQIDDNGTIFKVDGQRINCDTWNDLFWELSDDDEGRVFDATPTVFLPIAASQDMDRDIEGEGFGERRASVIAEHKPATEAVVETKLQKKEFDSAKGNLQKTDMVKGRQKPKAGAESIPFWSFEKEIGYQSYTDEVTARFYESTGEYFEPSPDAPLPVPDWPPRLDMRPPSLRKIIPPQEGKIKSDIAETSFPAASAGGKKKIRAGASMRRSAAAPQQMKRATTPPATTVQETSFAQETTSSNGTEPGPPQNEDNLNAAADDTPVALDVPKFDVPPSGLVSSLLRANSSAVPAAMGSSLRGLGVMPAQNDGNVEASESPMGFDEDSDCSDFGSDFGAASEDGDQGYLDVDKNAEAVSTGKPAVPKWKQQAGAGGAGGKGAASSMLLLLAVSLSVALDGASALTLEAGFVRPPNVIGADLEEAAAKVAYLNHKRFGNNFDKLHQHFDADHSGYLSVRELSAVFVSARIGSDPTRKSWAASFTQSFARSIPHGVSPKDLNHCYSRLGFAGTGQKCASGAGFCPKLPSDIKDRYMHALEEEEAVYGAGEDTDCAECSQARAMDSVRWPRLPFNEKVVDKYALHSIFDDVEVGCDVVAFEECLLVDNSTCTECAQEFECPFREALFRVAGGRFVGPQILASPHFLPGLLSMDAYAAQCNVLLNVQSSLQYELEPSATDATIHGEALRVHVEDGAGLCDPSCMRNSTLRRPAVSCFLALVEKDPLFMWAGHHLNASAPNATNIAATFDPALFEAYPNCNNLLVKGHLHPNCTIRGDTTKASEADILALFHDFSCARAVSLGPATKLKVETVAVDHSVCLPDETFDATTDSVAVFPSGLRAIIKSWALQPFGIEEYATPFGNDETAPLIDATDYADAHVSKSIKLTDLMSGAICNSHLQLPVTVNGKASVRNRLVRVSPTLVKGLENLLSNSYQRVEIVQGYQTKSEADARGETNQWYRTGAAARVAYSETDARIRSIDLAAEAIRAFHPVVRQAGLCLGIGLHLDGVHLDVRPPSTGSHSSIHAWAAGGTDLSSAEFKAWAEQEFARVPLMLAPAEDDHDAHKPCQSEPSDLPWKQRQSVGGSVVAGAPPRSGGGEWCGRVRGELTTHFDEVWALVTTRYETLEMANRRPLSEVEGALRWCLQSCDGASLEAPAPGSVASNKIRACSQALHWLPFSVESVRGTCSLATSGSPLKSTACFWGVCEEATELYGLMGPQTTFQPVLPVVQPQDPKCGAEELVYGAYNPTPVRAQVQALYAHHCSGRVMVFVDSPKELMALEPSLKAMMVYNADVVFVDIRVSPPAYDAVVSAMDGLVKAWKPTVCQHYTARQFLAPYTMVKIGANEIKSAVPVAV